MKKLPESGPRDATIRKSNELIQRSRFELTLQQQKIVLFLISKIQPWDDDFKAYDFKISDFCRLCGIVDGGEQYKDLKASINALKGKGIDVPVSADLTRIDVESEWTTQAQWIGIVAFNEHSGLIRIKLHPLMKPFLLQLKDNFTKYEFWNILLFRSRYSVRLYELVKSLHYHDLKPYSREFPVGELKILMGAETYNITRDFERRALNPAVKEINTFTDKFITCERITRGRTITGYNLTITSKSYGEIAACRARVERELGAEQLTLWESIAARLTAEANSDPSGGTK